MDSIEELKKRKEALELQREIARLERQASVDKRLGFISGLSWWVIGPLLVIGIIFLFASIDTGELAGLVFSALFCAPAAIKFFKSR
ncbi:hypothetical protein [Comamonas thiooxydans]|uniref:hypothetical protein n=1 Tax=Comamonas thiooxydans TaxID=363952 RepID=UPI00209BCB88|nr:hypothetical protein [Comamonas thiooxydans]MCO8251124.1 hypothetical protein [Comamonas thiooxydans]